MLEQLNSMDISVYSHIVLSLNVGSMYRMNRVLDMMLTQCYDLLRHVKFPLQEKVLQFGTQKTRAQPVHGSLVKVLNFACSNVS